MTAAPVPASATRTVESFKPTQTSGPHRQAHSASADMHNFAGQFRHVMDDVLSDWLEGRDADSSAAVDLYASWVQSLPYPDPAVPTELPEATRSKADLRAWSLRTQRRIANSRRTSTYSHGHGGSNAAAETREV